RDDPLEPHAARPDAQREVIVAVGTRRDEQPVAESRPPVAVETAEEHLAKAPLRAEVRFGRATADDAILLAEILGIPFQASIELRMRYDHGRAEVQRERGAPGEVAVARAAFSQRIAGCE